MKHTLSQFYLYSTKSRTIASRCFITTFITKIEIKVQQSDSCQAARTSKCVRYDLWRTYCCCPAGFIMMSPTGEHHHPDKSHHKAEDRDKHDPALRIFWHYQCACHQDPHQTTKNLQQHVYIMYTWEELEHVKNLHTGLEAPKWQPQLDLGRSESFSLRKLYVSTTCVAVICRTCTSTWACSTGVTAFVYSTPLMIDRLHYSGAWPSSTVCHHCLNSTCSHTFMWKHLRHSSTADIFLS